MSLLRQNLEQFLGLPGARALSYNLARLGLHGLGVGLPPTPDRSGELYFLRQLVKAVPIDSAVDIGGNVGDYTRMLLDLNIPRVTTFEPVPASFERLRAAFEGDERVELHPVAVGEYVGGVTLNLPSDSETSVLASRGDGASGFTAATLVPIEVPMVTLDSAFDDGRALPDFLKIDVEGYEQEVLAGCRNLIRSGSLKAVQIEFSYHHIARGTTLKTFETLLPGYRLFRIASRSLRPLESGHYLGTIYGYSNFVALRPDIVKMLLHLI